MLRWASDEALNIYARDGADVIASWLDAARQAEVTSVRSSSLPDVHGVTPVGGGVRAACHFGGGPDVDGGAPRRGGAQEQ
eukprot:7380761-Prymnesium_polylepis.1